MPQRVIRFLHVLLRFGMPLVLAIALVLSAYDRFHPWALADDMVPNRPNQTRWLIGAGYSRQSTYAASGDITVRSAEYVFFPEVLKTKRSYHLSQASDREPSVSVDPFSPALYILGLICALAIGIGAWWFPLAREKTGAHVA